MVNTEIGRCIDQCKEEFFIPSDAVDQGIHNGYEFTFKRFCRDSHVANDYVV